MAIEQNSQNKTFAVKDLPQRQSEDYISIYSNYIEISFGNMDIQFLIFDVTQDEQGKPVKEKKARLVMSPEHAKSFRDATIHTITQWVEKHGGGKK